MTSPSLRAAGPALVVAALGATAAPAAAAPLSANLGLRIDGRLFRQHVGTFVANAGDVNGDGLGDVLAGTQETHVVGAGRRPVWSAYVVFGRRRAAGATLRLDRLCDRGLRIVRTSGDFVAGAGAGDVNGDGLDDVVLGTGAADDTGGGSAYVVYGRRRGGTIDVGHLSGGGFVIRGRSGAVRGAAVAGAGDLDRDGFAGVLVGEPGAVPAGGEFGTGRVVVVFGARRTTAIDTRRLGTRGADVIGPGPFRFAPGTADQRLFGVGFGDAVAAAGDADGDGRADVAIGAPYLGGREGGAYVVTGVRRGTTIDLRTGAGPWYLIAGRGGDAQGFAVAGVGDHNGDGRAELLVGELAGGGGLVTSRGPSGAFLVHGRRDGAGVDLGSLGADGTVFGDATSGDRAGQSVAAAGDLTGDGRRDLVIGGPLADPGGVRGAGSVFVVAGGALPQAVNLRASAARRYDGRARNDTAGWSVAGLGDVNGDCRADLAIGVPRAEPLAERSGSVFVIYGRGRAARGC